MIERQEPRLHCDDRNLRIDAGVRQLKPESSPVSKQTEPSERNLKRLNTKIQTLPEHGKPGCEGHLCEHGYSASGETNASLTGGTIYGS